MPQSGLEALMTPSSVAEGRDNDRGPTREPAKHVHPMRALVRAGMFRYPDRNVEKSTSHPATSKSLAADPPPKPNMGRMRTGNQSYPDG